MMNGFKPTSRKLASNILLVCFSTSLTIVLCEVALRLADRSTGDGYYFHPASFRTVLKPSSDITPGISGDSEFRTNSDGLRGDELAPRHTYRILAVGASTTICRLLDQSETWTDLLQQTLNRNTPQKQIWVGNGGVSGLTTNHHVVALQHWPLRELKIDAVILLIGVNDLAIRLSRDSGWEPTSLDTPKVKYDLLAQNFNGTVVTDPSAPIYERTAIWRLLRKVKRVTSGYLEDEYGRSYVTWRQHRQQASEILDRLPDLTSVLNEYARNINRIIDISHEQSVRPIFMTQPTIWKAGLPQNLDSLLWLGGVGDFQRELNRPYYSAAALERGMKAFNDTLLRVCRARHIECLDLSSTLEKDTTVFYDDVHFNESGARKIAETLTRYMLERPPFREPLRDPVTLTQ
jgi:lysophospholipase L1-like esterase